MAPTTTVRARHAPAAEAETTANAPDYVTSEMERMRRELRELRGSMKDEVKKGVKRSKEAMKAFGYAAGTTFAIFICLSNSLTALAKALWSDVGNIWAVGWKFIESLSSHWTMFVIGTMLIHFVAYWSLGLLFHWLDINDGPSFWRRYKIQPGKNAPVQMSEFWKAARTVLFNQIVIGIPGMMFVVWPLAQWRGMSCTAPLPNFQRFVGEMVVFVLVEEVLFYYAHRAFHHPSLYGRVHKQHHEFKAPIAIAAIYASPIEHIFSNLLPLLAGPLLMGSHLATLWAWILIGTINTVNTHSGYHLPWAPSPEAHDWHHLRFNENFGVLGLLDYIHGTDKSFRKSKKYERHETFFSMDGYPEAVAQEKAEKAEKAAARSGRSERAHATPAAAPEETSASAFGSPVVTLDAFSTPAAPAPAAANESKPAPLKKED